MSFGHRRVELEEERRVVVPVGETALEVHVWVPAPRPVGVVVLVQGAEMTWHAEQHLYLTESLLRYGLATVLFDLLLPEEREPEADGDSLTGLEYRFNLPLLTQRLVAVTRWVKAEPDLGRLGLGYLGSGMGTAVALFAAGSHPDWVGALVSQGGRPDLARSILSRVQAPTMLIVGGEDFLPIQENRDAYARLTQARDREMVLIPEADPLFGGPGDLETLSHLSVNWFLKYLQGCGHPISPSC
jgi:dienelactone hydrolase